MTSSAPNPVGGAADRLAAVVALRELLEQFEDAAVEGALRDGWTWPQIKRLEHAGIDLRRRRG
jgi:hypothetical protein